MWKQDFQGQQKTLQTKQEKSFKGFPTIATRLKNIFNTQDVTVGYQRPPLWCFWTSAGNTHAFGIFLGNRQVFRRYGCQPKNRGVYPPKSSICSEGFPWKKTSILGVKTPYFWKQSIYINLNDCYRIPGSGYKTPQFWGTFVVSSDLSWPNLVSV